MWSEEEMCEVEDRHEVLDLEGQTGGQGKPRSGRSNAAALRSELSGRNVTRARTYAHELTRGAPPSVIYEALGKSHGNFFDASYREIVRHPEWRKRLDKAHTSKRQGRRKTVGGWRELDSANSSDALLMNIFCYPRLLARPSVLSLLGLERGALPRFGVRAHIPLRGGLEDTTEIDMKLGELMVEAKLTESDFQTATMRLLERYRDLDLVFRRDALPLDAKGRVRSYQLIRCVLAAHLRHARFCVLLDARRPDLLDDWFVICSAVSSFELQARLHVLTWQELAFTLPRALQVFLSEKYGIDP